MGKRRLAVLLGLAALLVPVLLGPMGTVKAATSVLHLEGGTEWYNTSTTVVTSVVTKDLDNDGAIEVITGGYADLVSGRFAQLRVWRFNGTHFRLVDSYEWQMAGTTEIRSVFAEDIDGDATVEIVTGGWYDDGTRNQGQVMAFNLTSDSLIVEGGINWYGTDDTIVNGIWATNVDTDANVEVITVGTTYMSPRNNTELRLWEYNDVTHVFSLQEAKSTYTGDWSQGKAVTAGQADSDSDVEILVAGTCKGSSQSNFEVRIWHVESGLLTLEKVGDWAVTVYRNGLNAICLGDLTGDGDNEVIMGGYIQRTNQGILDAYLAEAPYDGNNMPIEGYEMWPGAGDTEVRGVFVQDTDGDGDQEIISAGYTDDGLRYKGQLFVAHYDPGAQPADKTVHEAWKSWYGPGSTGVNGLWVDHIDNDTSYEIITGGWQSDGSRFNGQLRSWTCDYQAPNQVTLLGPTSGTETNNNTPLLSWSAASDPTPSSGVLGYYFELDTIATFDSGNLRSLWIGNVTTFSPTVLSDGIWYWRVRAQDVAGYNGAWSSIWNLFIDTVGPSATGPSSPFSGTVTTNPTPTFTWTAASDPLPSSGVAGYYWEIDTNALFTSPDRRLIWVGNQLTYTPTALPDGTWYWRIFAADDAGNNGTASAIWSITIDATPPDWDQPPTNQVSEFGSPFHYDLNASDWHGVDTWWINDTTNFDIDAAGIITNNSVLNVDVYWVQVWVNDTLGNTRTTTYSVTVQDTTNPTWDTAPANQLTELGSPILYDVDASDLSGILSYWINDTSGFSIDGSGTISNASFLPVGDYWVEVRAYDPYSNYVAATFKVTVQDTTAPAWDESPSNQFLEFGLPFFYEVNASDLGGISSYWVNDTTHFIIDINGILTNATGLTVGIYGVELRAYDPSTNFCTATISITVQDTIAPTWDQTPANQLAEYGFAFTYNMNASDLSGISYYWINDTSQFVINTQGIISNNTNLAVGVYWIEIRSYDPSTNYCFATISVTVEDTTSPTWDWVPSNQVNEIGQPTFYDVDASDLSGISSYWINDTSRFSIDMSGTITNATFLVVGEFWVEVRAYDPYTNYVSAIFRFTVQDTTAPSWITLPTNQILEFGQAFSYDVDAFDFSGIASYWLNDTTHFAIDGTGNISNVTGLLVGIYWVEIRAYDPYTQFAAATFKITVQDTTAPTWDEVPSNQFLEFGLAFSYEVNASDYGGISSYWVNDTAHFTITVDGLLTNATGLTVGIYGVELRAYDPSNNYCTAIIQVIVQDTNDPTWDEPATDQQFELGDMFSYNLNASDPSGISQWWLNDTTHFAIDSTGLITNVGLVPVGIHALEVRAYDPYSRYCSREFTITVEDTVMPTWDVTPTNPVIEFGDSFS
ncbi:MAG: hypothetical protein ACFFCJ_07765, partial [Promethearchaeota archaeon]